MYHRPIGLSKEAYTLTGKTANYFLTGLFPVSDLDVEHHMEYDTMA